MSAGNLPDFKHTLSLVQGKLEASELAECHGVACGLLSRDTEATLDAFIALLELLELVKTPEYNFKLSLEELLGSTRSQLADEDMGLSLWLPGDDETLEDRTYALGPWCNGYLAGLGAGGKGLLSALSDDANEAMKDLQQIATADVTDTSESEEDENAYSEIVEYIRVVVLMIQEDFRGPGGQDLIH